MITPEQRQALLAAAADLQVGMRELGEKFARVEAFSYETRKITRNHDKTNRRLAAVVGALALMLIALGVTTVRANNANDKASRNAEYQLASCVATNERRAENVKLWDQVIVLLLNREGANPSKGLLEFTSALKVQVDKTFAPRDCAQVPEGRTG